MRGLTWSNYLLQHVPHAVTASDSYVLPRGKREMNKFDKYIKPQKRNAQLMHDQKYEWHMSAFSPIH